MANRQALQTDTDMDCFTSNREEDDYKLLRKELTIDRDDLDNALINQSNLFYRVAKWSVRAQTSLEEAKADLDRIEQEISLQVRKQATAATGDEKAPKITDKHVATVVASTPKYQKQENELLKAKARVASWSILKDSYMYRASMLKSLVQLFVSEYYMTSADRSVSRTKTDSSGSNKRDASGHYRDLADKYSGRGRDRD